ncbi:unnamed protein product [Lymnaea stagnalis]|uniref:BRCT domain-containing protein n=1 Tax=Lymnaea stagnalis TaxID=6523 RepID=A0AAV2HZM5_LYMST
MEKALTLVYIIPQKFQKKRLNDIKLSMVKKKIPNASILGPDVTHIVSESDSYEQVLRFVEEADIPEEAEIVSTRWLVECLQQSKIVLVLEVHRLKKIKADNVISPKTTTDQNYEWACQRGARLEHFNKKFTVDLELLQTHAEFCNEMHSQSRALAFRRASCVLKTLLFPLTHIKQLDGVKYIGGHVRKVISDLLDLGSSPEVEEIKFSDWFRKMKLFTSIFGVGPATAKSWIEKGWKSIEDVRNAGHPSKDWRIVWGLAFHEDLTTPVSRQEADRFMDILQCEAQNILPGTIITLTGGFRRGKSNGHDIDILITHPTDGAELGILSKLLDVLDKKDIILSGQRMKNTFSTEALNEESRSMHGKFDHFEKWFGICKFPKAFQHPTTPSGCQSSKEDSTEVKDNKNSSTHSDPLGLPFMETQLTRNSNNLSVPLVSVKTDLKHRSNVKNKSYISNTCVYEGEGEPHVPSTKKFKHEDCSEKEVVEMARPQTDWLARRVDLIVTPYSQYYYALVGWTGSKHFNRDTRLYAQQVLNLRLTSHGLYDMKKQEALQATCEEDVFRHLNLTYRDPMDRNC